MKDFDFDEIDKAVTGAIATNQPAESNDDAQVVPSNAVPSDTETVKEPATVMEQKTAPAVRRTSGRFMDVVHPSSDMRGRPVFTPPVPQSPPTVPPVAVAPEVTPVTPDVPKASSFEDSFEELIAPLQSPFLPDAKVEKRPLGGSGVVSPAELQLGDLPIDEPDEPHLEAPDELRIEAPDEPLLEAGVMPDPIDFAGFSPSLESEKEDTGASELPAEEPVIIEGPIVVEEAVEVETLNEPEGASSSEASSLPVVEEAPLAPSYEDTSPAPQDDIPSGPSSITQQYAEQPSSAEAPGTMYDTEAYHQPVTPPVKKKSGVWVVLWILLLVLLGGGAGVAFYLFVLPML